MSPGLELDILVAERVMGLKVYKNTTCFRKGRVYYTIGEPVWFDMQGAMQLQNSVPNYSEDIASAWEVVEKLREMNKRLTLVCDGNEWIVFPRSARADDWEMSSHSTLSAPHAICLAALKVFGAEI